VSRKRRCGVGGSGCLGIMPLRLLDGRQLDRYDGAASECARSATSPPLCRTMP
jgi:hypothetical protein